jgi:shikimate kinase
MGAGKSSVGRALAQQLNWPFEDLDGRIEHSEGRTIAAIFRDAGEQAFRRAEHSALRQVLKESRAGVARVVALGGGAFVQRRNAALLKRAGTPAVFLDAPVEELWRRCRRQADEGGSERPLLRDFKLFRALYRSRRKGYLQAPVKIAAGGRRVEPIAAEIVKKLGLKRIAIRSKQGEVE